ncbi:hypothetical protein OG500_30145 [Kitasatospora sp. NBC_01250]|uniref:hypothetical protein n=1 Tax=Kitasatospora sp. NBC_01250 TaxID=2903571 RepID=UPI002E341389|nr:hypothetical protein [Kitasatospora sp. NBC_01250]
MFFEPEDEDGYAATCELLTGRLAAWSRAQGLAAEPVVVESALDYRHRGTVDGRLGLWQARHVEEFLLDWLPRMLTQLPGEPTADGPAGLRTLLSYLCAMGLDDPRGEPLDVLERAIDAVSPMFAEAMADRTRWGMAKFWATTAAEQGVDIFDQVAMERFTERARRGEVPYDEAALEAIARRHQVTGPPQMARAEPQLPVTLPAEDELRTTATAVPLIGQLAALAEWAGKDGRELTKLGRLKIADARELVATLRTGDRPGSPRSSADLPLLNLVFEWAKKARLVRPAKGRLYAVAKARPVLNDPLALWQRAFEALFELREALIGDRDGYRPTSMLYAVYEDILPDILNTLYSLPHPMPWPRLRESTHLAYRARYRFSGDDTAQERMWLRAADADLHDVLDALERLGILTREQGMAHPLFLDMPAVPSAPTLPPGMPPELAFLLGAPAPDPDAPQRAQELRKELTAGPVELIRLTDLGTRAVRLQLLAEGRDAPLVGELADAPAGGLLGVLAEHYDPDSARTELATWTAAHGGDQAALAELVQAVRDTPWRSRAEAILDTLTTALPDGAGEHLLRALRSDPQLAPTALSVLTRREILVPDDLTEPESLLILAEGLLQLLEVAGQDSAMNSLLSQGRKQAREIIAAALASGHPDQAGLAALRSLADGPLWERSAQLGRQNAARARKGGTRDKRKRRR